MSRLLLLVCALVCVLSLPVSVSAGNYAVLVAGSNTWGNYRHQADVCHAYQIVRRHGIPEQNIYTFIFDDLFNNTENPFPGQVFNHPTPNGTAGIDVYKGCGGSIEGNVFRGGDVIPEVFMAVITANKTGLPKGKNMLTSTNTDDVFINFVDHGGPGDIYFPGFIPFSSDDLIRSLHTMHDKGMYQRLVFYLEACEAGSMFGGLLPANMTIYAMTASNWNESSWGTYCPTGAIDSPSRVDGVDLETCLGDLFSVNWMEDTDRVGVKESLFDQYKTVDILTNLSHTERYGDLSWSGLPIGAFLGSVEQALDAHMKEVLSYQIALTPDNTIQARDVSLHTLYKRYQHRAAESDYSAKRKAMKALATEVNMRVRMDTIFETFATQTYSTLKARHTMTSVTKLDDLFAMPSLPIIHTDCMNSVRNVFYEQCGGHNEYSTQYGSVIINACRAVDDGQLLSKAMGKACQGVTGHRHTPRLFSN